MSKLGITVELVAKTKMAPYFNSEYMQSLDPEVRDQKINQYIEVMKEPIQLKIDQAETLYDTILNTCKDIKNNGPTMIRQISAMTGMQDPIAKTAQMTSISTEVMSQRNMLYNSEAQLSLLKNLLMQLSISNPLVNQLAEELTLAKMILDTIPV